MTSKNNHDNVVPSLFEEISSLFQIGAKKQFDVKKIVLAEKDMLDQHIDMMKYHHIKLNFMRSNYKDVYDFFQDTCKDYDSDLVNPYWAFTHDILKFILTTFITEHFRNVRTIRVFDAGAGTGNWSRFVLNLGLGISAIMFDMNTNMLKIAKPKLAQLNNDVCIVEGNLENSNDYPHQRSNLVLCMHNVIGLARNTEVVLHNLCEYLEDAGLAFIMAMNKYHAFNFVKQFRDEVEVLRIVQDGTVKFKDDMPEMFCYTPKEFERILRDAGFNEVTILGFPVTVYPSMKDTKLLQKGTLIHQLKDPKFRSELLTLEKKLCLYPELAYRGGSNLIAICKKTFPLLINKSR